MATRPDALTDAMSDFLAERHLATLSLAVPGSDMHVTPVGFSWDPKQLIARVITWEGANKTRLIEAAGSVPAVLAQVDGGRWLALHGTATVTADPAVCADAERRYAARYRPPSDRGADRRTIEVVVERVVGRA